MAKKSQKRSKQNKAKKVKDLPIGPEAKNVKGGSQTARRSTGEWFVFGSSTG